MNEGQQQGKEKFIYLYQNYRGEVRMDSTSEYFYLISVKHNHPLVEPPAVRNHVSAVLRLKSGMLMLKGKGYNKCEVQRTECATFLLDFSTRAFINPLKSKCRPL